MSFLGDFTPRLDDKGRLTLPARFRTELAGGVVVAKGSDHSLEVYPAAVFERKIEVALQASRRSERGRVYLRHLTAGADEQVPDGQGRITIAPKHRTYAGLTKDCVATGTGDHVEIWDAGRFAEYLAATEDQYANTVEAELLGELSLDPAPPTTDPGPV